MLANPLITCFLRPRHACRRLGALLVLAGLALPAARAQNKVSLKDAKEMTYQAQATVEGLQNLLNYVTFNDNVPSELAEVLQSSYTPAARNQLFVSQDAVVEDDLSPAATLGATQDLPADKYLNALDLRYAKTPDATIRFANLTVSSIRKKDFVYVLVRFDETFGSQEKASGSAYPVRQREALVRLTSQGGSKWQALIASLSFYDPAQPAPAATDELPITTDASAEASLVSTEDFVREKEDFVLARQQEEKRKQIAFDEYVALGSGYSANKQYKDALELFYKAKELRPLVPTLDKRILDTKRLLAENTFESLRNKAEQAKAERRHGDALRYYKEALASKPEARPVIEAEIALLTRRLNEIALPKNKLEAGDYQGAIDACDNILKENKKTKGDFAELYFIKGQAYQLAADKQAGDARALDRALDNYTLAIQSYPTYVQALLARANFYVKYRHDYVKAITDYDVVTTNVPDEAADKPRYFVVKAQWKDQVNNYAGALDDYAQAIALRPEYGAPHFAMGELLYRQQRCTEALASFNTALRLEPKNSRYYYYRGLNYVVLKDVAHAGEDFAAGEKLGLEPAQLQNVEAISTSFFEAGQQAAKARRPARADSLYDQALAVRGCNAKAWHGKAEIRLAAAEAQARQRPAAAESYQQAIELYQKALDCQPAYSDAFYKKGLAYHRTGEFAPALKSYTDAIRTDAGSVVAHVGRGSTALATQRYQQAIADYTQATLLLQNNVLAARKNSQKELAAALTTQQAQAYQLLGEAWYRKKDFAKAVLSTTKALELDEKNAEALYYQGLAYEGLHDLPKALKCYADAIRYAPRAPYYYASGRAALLAEKYEQAIGSLSAAAKLDTARALPDTYYLRGLSYFKSKLLEPASQDFAEHARRAEPTDSAFHTAAGRLHLYLNHDAAAVEEFRLALAARPTYPLALYGLGCAYAKAGQFEQALQQFARAYQTRRLRKEDVKPEEEAFLTELNKVKAHKTQYAQLRKTYLATTP